MTKSLVPSLKGNITFKQINSLNTRPPKRNRHATYELLKRVLEHYPTKRQSKTLVTVTKFFTKKIKATIYKIFKNIKTIYGREINLSKTLQQCSYFRRSGYSLFIKPLILEYH